MILATLHGLETQPPSPTLRIEFTPPNGLGTVSVDAGCAAVRVNPGNIRKFDDQVKEIARAATDAGVSLRIGVNAGSLDPRLLAKYGKATPEALVESAVWEASLFEEHDFHDFKISVKHNDPVVMVRAYELLSERGDWPLHLGVTEAGPAFQGTIKSSVAFGALLAKGIGDTIRVSLSAPPVEEVKVGNAILQSLGLRERGLDLVACPSCGRAEVNVLELTKKVEAAIHAEEFGVPLRVAVMGCVVNGPGEAREADIGIAGGKGVTVAVTAPDGKKEIKADLALQTIEHRPLPAVPGFGTGSVTLTNLTASDLTWTLDGREVAGFSRDCVVLADPPRGAAMRVVVEAGAW